MLYYCIVVYYGPFLYIVSFRCCVFCLLVVLVKLTLLAKWLARKTPLKKPNRGEGIISIKPRPNSAHDFLGLLYCFIVSLCICVVSCPYVIYYPTVMARYSLFVLKVPLNPKQANKQTMVWVVFFKLTQARLFPSAPSFCDPIPMPTPFDLEGPNSAQ